MDLLLILTYTAICVAIFKIFRIPLNKWSVPTAVLGGVVLIGTLILLMNYNHPHTAMGSQMYVTTPLIPSVRGKVIEVPVIPNKLLKEGELLFRVDPTPYQTEVTRLEASLEQAKQAVLGLDAAYKAAEASRIKAEAERDRTQLEYERYRSGFEKGAFTRADVDNRRQYYLGAQASVEAAEAEARRAKLALEAEYQGQNTQVAEIAAMLEKARFNLEETSMRAPSDGYVTQLTLRPGMMVVPMPLRPVMTFVHQEERFFVGAFRQNSLLRLKPGFKAELIFRALPGKVFQAEVVEVLPAIGESQVQAQGQLYGSSQIRLNGRPLVKLKPLDDLSQYHLPLGTNVEIAIYSDSFEHVSIMRKVLIRMKSWQNYLYLDH
ncbi:MULTISPECIES: HlyD family secretion protein [Shewanella]|uniref:Inner membrane protein yiaV n=1 Tax=Shewanella algae TaxID=38313 RepID=A0A380A497_9GAMM|nr:MULTISPECIES: HlyD family secretion protein [Shewanella]AYV15257.1 HlyD family secretion protein [Shewanella algae]MBO2554097.1 HlyD family secretion protein [Shewanella algae]MBO2562606.1 HlyD family secretion protein [Shewanella algae]MBO2579641.1 HlyD family secretion protein [Shewanella algae]MBO2588260.1 HlyD family secretion protein [Shewanella algae]